MPAITKEKVDESVIPPLKSYLAFSVTKCPTKSCEDCVGLYTNGIVGIRVSCECPCHSLHYNNNEKKQQTKSFQEDLFESIPTDKSSNGWVQSIAENRRPQI